MKIFAIHSGSDMKTVEEIIKRIKNETVSTEILALKNGGRFWKLDAGKKIKMAQLVIVFIGEHSHESPNIKWEINKAYSAKKRIVCLPLSPDYKHPAALEKAGGYEDNKHHIGEDMTIEEVINYIKDYNSGDYALFNHADETDMATLFEQYKVFLQTSETLVARRQSVSNFYISVNSAIIAIYSTVMAMTNETRWKYLACIMCPILGIVLCCAWIKILRSYGNLNASKMRIISILEKRLPASLYDAEWRAQSDKLNAKPYVSFTDAEIRIPKLFIIIYSVIILACVAQLILSFGA